MQVFECYGIFLFLEKEQGYSDASVVQAWTLHYLNSKVQKKKKSARCYNCSHITENVAWENLHWTGASGVLLVAWNTQSLSAALQTVHSAYGIQGATDIFHYFLRKNRFSSHTFWYSNMNLERIELHNQYHCISVLYYKQFLLIRISKSY